MLRPIWPSPINPIFMVRIPHRGLALQLLPKVSAAGSG